MNILLLRISYAFALGLIILLFSFNNTSHALVTLVEPGHNIIKIVDSSNPLHPSQGVLNNFEGTIESIGVNPLNGTIYIQLWQGQVMEFLSTTTGIYAVSPSGVVSPINTNTMLGINSRGTDLHFDPNTGLLVTMDSASLPSRIATIHPDTGIVGTYSEVTPPVFGGEVGGTFGMQFSDGLGGSVVPSGDIVFTTDVEANGIYSAFFGGLSSSLYVIPPEPGDDMVIQPDGDWVHVPDGSTPLTAYIPSPPHTATPSPTGLNIEQMFLDAGLIWIFGTRATVCSRTGDLYVSFSGVTGGSGVFRVDETLSTASLILTISGNKGLQDLIVGPSTIGSGQSVFFTIQDFDTGSKEVWELTEPNCSPSNVQVPTLSEWGLIAMAAILGIVGFLVIRKRQATA